MPSPTAFINMDQTSTMSHAPSWYQGTDTIDFGEVSIGDGDPQCAHVHLDAELQIAPRHLGHLPLVICIRRWRTALRYFGYSTYRQTDRGY